MLVTEITTSPSTLENGQRSPERVRRLVQAFQDLRIGEAIEEARGDATIHKALSTIKSHHRYGFRINRETGQEEPLVNWRAAEATWRMVLEKLRHFAYQEGGQRLLPREKVIPFLREEIENLTETAKS